MLECPRSTDLGDLILSHGFKYHLYTDDSQIYISSSIFPLNSKLIYLSSWPLQLDVWQAARLTHPAWAVSTTLSLCNLLYHHLSTCQFPLPLAEGIELGVMLDLSRIPPQLLSALPLKYNQKMLTSPHLNCSNYHRFLPGLLIDS